LGESLRSHPCSRFRCGVASACSSAGHQLYLGHPWPYPPQQPLRLQFFVRDFRSAHSSDTPVRCIALNLTCD
jgi:hypothetical protein